jgi:hypothetical protein
MAPSAIETTTLSSRTVEPTAKLTSNIGPYKELASVGYSKQAEEEGTGAAKVWDNAPTSRDLTNIPKVQALPAHLGKR